MVVWLENKILREKAKISDIVIFNIILLSIFTTPCCPWNIIFIMLRSKSQIIFIKPDSSGFMRTLVGAQ